LVTILAIFPLFVIFNMISIDFSRTLIEDASSECKTLLEMLYYASGEFVLRWMTAVLACTTFFILFANNDFSYDKRWVLLPLFGFLIMFLFDEIL
jgi:sulfoxide reductase heme-binding subunit YedZ